MVSVPATTGKRSAFIATDEANADARYKQAIVDGRAADIVYLDLFTGVHGNYLRASIVAAGLDPDDLPQGNLKTMSFASGGAAKAWRDIWGSGQGIGAIDTVVPADATPLETARLLQAHFRSSQYTYSLQLPTPTDLVSGRAMMSDPLSNFLVSRTGYCVQFATAFIMAARLKGIPARMAIGFLPGS